MGTWQKLHNRRLRFDLLRICSAVAVTIFHWGGGGWYSQELKLDYPRPGGITEMNRFAAFGWLGVDLFFAISGYVIVESISKRNFREFAKSRFLRLIPTYWIITLISFFLSILTVRAIDYHLLAKSMVGINFFFGEEAFIPAAWTLAVEIQFYIIASLFFKLKKYQNAWQIFCTIYLIFSLTLQIIGANQLSFIAISQFGPLFVLGISMRQYELHKSSINVALIATSSLMSVKSLSDRLIAWNTIDLISSLVIASFIICTFLLIGILKFTKIDQFNLKVKISGVVIYLSKLTYPFYLLHENFGEGVISICYQLVRNSYISWLTSLWVCLMLSASILRFADWVINRYLVRSKIGFRD